MNQDATWYEGSPLPKKGAEPPKFSAHVDCGQTAGWIKMVGKIDALVYRG